MAAKMILKFALPVSALCYAERFVINNHPEMLGGLANVFYGPVLKAYGLVIGVNIVASGFVLIALASKVGQARKKYDFQLPRLYNPEDTEEAKKFNCVQRGHQQALETYTQFIATSLVGGIRNPITTALFGVIWCVSRMKWAEGYATGDPAARYSHSFWGRHIWTGLLGVLGTSVSTMLGIFMA